MRKTFTAGQNSRLLEKLDGSAGIKQYKGDTRASAHRVKSGTLEFFILYKLPKKRETRVSGVINEVLKPVILCLQRLNGLLLCQDLVTTEV